MKRRCYLIVSEQSRGPQQWHLWFLRSLLALRRDRIQGGVEAAGAIRDVGRRSEWRLLSKCLLAILNEPRPRDAAAERRQFLQLLKLEDEAHSARVANVLIEKIETACSAVGLAVLKTWRPVRVH